MNINNLEKIQKLNEFIPGEYYLLDFREEYSNQHEHTKILARCTERTNKDRCYFEDIVLFCGDECTGEWHIIERDLDKDWYAYKIPKEDYPEYFL